MTDHPIQPGKHNSKKKFKLFLSIEAWSIYALVYIWINTKETETEVIHCACHIDRKRTVMEMNNLLMLDYEPLLRPHIQKVAELEVPHPWKIPKKTEVEISFKSTQKFSLEIWHVINTEINQFMKNHECRHSSYKTYCKS